MPTPDRTSLDEIVRAGRRLLESAGLDGLTMQAVADSVGVRAPSLYKRVRGRAELVALIAEATAHELGDELVPLPGEAGVDDRDALGRVDEIDGDDVGADAVEGGAELHRVSSLVLGVVTFDGYVT